MLDNDRKLVWAALIVFAVIALELTWFLFVGAPNPNSSQVAQQEAYQWIGDTLFSAAFWSAVFAGILMWSTIGLWQQTKRLAEGADDQSKKMVEAIKATLAIAGKTDQLAQNTLRTQRPFLTIVDLAVVYSAIRIPGFQIPDLQIPDAEVGQTTFTWKIVNRGRGAAFLKRTTFNLAFDKPIFPEMVCATMPYGGLVIIGEGETFTPEQPVYMGGTDREFLDPYFIPPQDRQSKNVYIAGVITYRDMFGVNRESGCLFFSYKRADGKIGFLGSGGPEFWFDRELPDDAEPT